MFKYLASYIKLLHIGLISYICLEICDPIPRLPIEFFLIEIGLTVINILITKKHFLDIFQIILSLNLTYALIPNNYSFIAGLFFFKIIFVYNSRNSRNLCIMRRHPELAAEVARNGLHGA